MKKLLEELKKIAKSNGYVGKRGEGFNEAMQETLICVGKYSDTRLQLITCGVTIGKSKQVETLIFRAKDYIKIEGKSDELRLYLKGDERVLRVTEEGRNYITEQMNLVE